MAKDKEILLNKHEVCFTAHGMFLLSQAVLALRLHIISVHEVEMSYLDNLGFTYYRLPDGHLKIKQNFPCDCNHVIILGSLGWWGLCLN